MSRTKNYLMEQEELFWDTANEVIGGCEHLSEFIETMVKDKRAQAVAMLHGWDEFWSKYQ